MPDKIIKKLKLKKITPKLNPGDLMLTTVVIHGSNKNKSSFDREGLTVSFKTKDAKINQKKC